MVKVILEIEGDSLSEVLATVNDARNLDLPQPMDANSLMALHGDTFSVDARAAGMLDYVPDLSSLTDLLTRLNPVFVVELVDALTEFRSATGLRDKIIRSLGIAKAFVKLTATEADDKAVSAIDKIIETPFVLDVLVGLVQRLLGSPGALSALTEEEDAAMKASAINIPLMMGIAQLLVSIIRTLIHNSKED